MRDKQQSLKKVVAWIGAATVVALGFTPPLENLAMWPSHLIVAEGDKIALPWSGWLPIKAVASSGLLAHTTRSHQQIELEGFKVGQASVRLELFGWMPWRTIPVAVAPPSSRVIPGGESVGIVARTRGLIVTALNPVVSNARRVDPAATAGIERGDIIMAINHQPVNSGQSLQHAVDQAGIEGLSLDLEVKGARTVHERRVKPVWASKTRQWQLGVLVEDATTGVGTMTFFYPGAMTYAALGHSITDGLTRQPVGIRHGHLSGAEIVGVVAGTALAPGQKVGVLAGDYNMDGSVTYNGRFGIVGRLRHAPHWGPHHTMPLALPDQVHRGNARVITVIHGQRPESFRIKILRTYPQWQPNTKGLLFEVTDRRLLKQAGGVVQGMSGSPIIQGGRVVGAVTHVLLNRPNLGFGCYAYWMATQGVIGPK